MNSVRVVRCRCCHFLGGSTNCFHVFLLRRVRGKRNRQWVCGNNRRHCFVIHRELPGSLFTVLCSSLSETTHNNGRIPFNALCHRLGLGVVQCYWPFLVIRQWQVLCFDNWNTTLRQNLSKRTKIFKYVHWNASTVVVNITSQNLYVAYSGGRLYCLKKNLPLHYNKLSFYFLCSHA